MENQNHNHYFQPENETMPAEQIKALQSERLVKQVQHVYDHVEYYRKKMDEQGVSPQDIHGVEDLHKLPFLTKEDLRQAYPYGLLAKPLSECVRIQSTSGTTGRRVVAFYTSMTSICGRNAVPAPSSPRAERKRTSSMSLMDMDCSPAVRGSTEDRISWAR
ncbi:MAG: hypothetical protein V8T10_07910 [Merdibacter sp.]